MSILKQYYYYLQIFYHKCYCKKYTESTLKNTSFLITIFYGKNQPIVIKYFETKLSKPSYLNRLIFINFKLQLEV